METAQLPTVEYKSANYFHEHACGGRASGSVLYIRMVIPPCPQA